MIERTLIARVQRHSFFDVDLKAGLAFFNRFNIVPDLALEAHIGNQAIARLWIDSRHVARIGIAVRIAVFHVEIHHEIVATRDRIAHDSFSLKSLN